MTGAACLDAAHARGKILATAEQCIDRLGEFVRDNVFLVRCFLSVTLGGGRPRRASSLKEVSVQPFVSAASEHSSAALIAYLKTTHFQRLLPSSA